MKLHLGVFDVPYVDEKGVTTGDVAEILERRYAPMGIFYEAHQQDIADKIGGALEKALRTALMGGPSDLGKVLENSTSEVDEMFKDFLSSREFEYQSRLKGFTFGVPTKAAMKGVNRRLKIKRGARRPSLIDTGQYQASFHSWLEIGK